MIRSTWHTFFQDTPWCIILIVQSELIPTVTALKTPLRWRITPSIYWQTHTNKTKWRNVKSGRPPTPLVDFATHASRTNPACVPPPAEILRQALIGVHSPKLTCIFPPAVIPFPAPHTTHQTWRESKQRVVCSSITAIILLWLFMVLILQWSREEQVIQAVQEGHRGEAE